MKTVLILEDIVETAQMLSKLVGIAFPDATIKHASTIASAMELLAQQSFDIAIIDLNLPDGDGTQVIAEIVKHHGDTIPVVATIFDDDKHLFSALEFGAKGYILKEDDEEQIVQSLKGILGGKPPLSTYIAQRILSTFHHGSGHPADTNTGQAKIDEASDTLSPREIEVLTLVAKGINRTDISRLLDISVNTVSTHIKRIYRKLSINTTSQASIAALKMGLVSKDLN